MTQLDLSAFGMFAATLDGRPLDGPVYSKVKALLIFLAVEAHRACHRDALAALLWPDQDEPQARLNLRKALSQLRGAFRQDGAGDPLLVTSRDTARLRPGAYHLDSAHFTALLDKALPQSGSADLNPAAIADLEAALALYKGPFLDQFAVSDSVAFSEWQLLLRERLHRRAVEACLALSAYYERAGRWGDVRRCSDRHLELDPWDERAHRGLMRALCELGQRAGALYQYERCRQVLRHELGVTPEPATTNLWEQIRASEATQPAPPAVGRLTPGSGDRQELAESSLPTPLTSLVGRREEVGALVTAMRSADVRLITLTGGPGVGKTRLALEVGAAVRPAFRHGVFFVSLAEVREPRLIPAAVLQALGGTDSHDMQPEQLLVRRLRDRHAVLILDSCEHVLAAAPCVAALLAACPQLKVLCTSRAPLRVYGEWLYQVPGLRVPAIDETDNYEAEAVQLFVQRARAASYDFALSEHNVAPVGAICAALDGMPLALELAAAKMQQLSPAALARQLHQCLNLLCDGPRDVAPRHRSLRAAIGWSYELLTPGQQTLFRHLGLFRGTFTLQDLWATRTVPNQPSLQEDLETLVEQSMVLRIGYSEPCYRLPAMLQAFACELLRLHGEGPDEPELAINLGRRLLEPVPMMPSPFFPQG